MKKCNAGHTMRLNIKVNDGNEDVGWHCDKCREYWGLDKHEQRIFSIGYKQALYDNSKTLKAHNQLIKALKNVLGINQ